MKLKKVTALLLATSMVISSVNVAPIFADEYIEEASFGTTEEASAEVDLSDDFGVTEDAADEANTATEEQALFDEEITDEVVEDENAFEQVVTDEVAYEENADIYEALENAEATASEDAGYAQLVELNANNAYMRNYVPSDIYSGSEIDCSDNLDVTANYNGQTIPISKDYVTVTCAKQINAGDYTYTVKVDYTTGDLHFVGSWEEPWKITAKDIATVTVTVDPTTFTYDGTEKDVTAKAKITDGTKDVTKEFTFSGDTKKTDVGNYTLKITGSGNYTGEKTQAWTITQRTVTLGPTLKMAVKEKYKDVAWVSMAPDGTKTPFGYYGWIKSNDNSLKRFEDYFDFVEVKQVEGEDVLVSTIPRDQYRFTPAGVVEANVPNSGSNYGFYIESTDVSNYNIVLNGFPEWNIVRFLPDGEKTYDGLSFTKDGNLEAWKGLDFLATADADFSKIEYWAPGSDTTKAADEVYTRSGPAANYFASSKESTAADEKSPNPWRKFFVKAGTAKLTYTWGPAYTGPAMTATIVTNKAEVTVTPEFSIGGKAVTSAVIGDVIDVNPTFASGDLEAADAKKLFDTAGKELAFDVKVEGKKITSLPNPGQFTAENVKEYTVVALISGETANAVAETDDLIINFAEAKLPISKKTADVVWKLDGVEVTSPASVEYDGKAHTVTVEFAKGKEIAGYKVVAAGDAAKTETGTYTATANFIKGELADPDYQVAPFEWEIKAAEVDAIWYYKEANATTWTAAKEYVSAPYSADGYEVKALIKGEDASKESEVLTTTVTISEDKLTYTGKATPKTKDYTVSEDTETFTLKMAKQEDNSLVVGIKNATIVYGSDPSAVTFEFAYYLEGKETTDENIVKWMEEHKDEITFAISDLYTKTTPVGTYADYMTAVVSKEIGRYTDPTTKKSYVVTGTTGDLTVGKASATSVMWDDIKTFTYDGQTHDFPKAVVYGLNGKVIKVKSYFKDAALTTPATEEKERGNYTVYIGELDDPNYDLSGIKASDLKCAWSINDDLSNLTAVYDSTQKYIKTPTNTALEYQFAVSVVNEGVIYTADRWQSEIPGAVNAGTYWTYYRTRKAGTNDAFGAPTYAVLKINKKPITATLKIDPIPVNGTLPTSATMADFEITGIEDVDSKAQFYMATGFTGDITDFWISKAGTESQVPYYSEITRTSGSYDVNFAKDYFGDKVDNKALILDKKGNYQVTLTKSTFTVGKVKVRIEWRIDDKKNNSKVEYDAAPHFALAYIISPSEYAGMVLEPMGDYARTEVGTYTATISATDLKRYEIVSGDTSYNWEITPKQIAVTTLMDKYNDGFGNNVIAYGTADPTSTLGRNDLVYYGIDEDGKINLSDPMTDYPYFDADDITGTPTFTTNYRQYNNVDYSGSLYHIDVDASALTAKNYTIVKALRAKLYVRPAKVTIVADNKNVGINATTMPKLTASFKDTVSGSGESAAAEHDFDAKVFTVEPTMDVYFPQTRGVYAIKVTPDDVTFTEPKRTYAELIAAGKPVNFEFQFTNGTYTVGEGDFEINLTDTRVAYDADPHTITGIPATLPNGIEIYYIDEEANGFVWASTAKGVFEENAKLASVNRVYKKTVGTHYVYWHIDGKDYGYDSYGVNKIVIIPNDQSKAEDLAKEIEEAVKTPLDNDKVKQARKDYDAADKAVQNHPAVGDAIKKLEAAEKEIADEAAKQIAALLPADPSKAVDTDRPNYEQAQGIYDALSDAEKALIPGSKTALDTAKAAIEADEAAKEKAFVDAVAALPAPADAKATDRAAVDAAKALYDGLTAAEKADPAVKDAKAKLDLVDAAVKAAEEGEDADKAAAKKVADMIEALPAPEDVTVADENAIKNAVDAFDALTEAQQALVPEADQEKLAADVLALAAAIVKEAEDQAAADEIEALIDAIATSEPGEGKAAMEAAKAAYDAATADVQAKVDKGHKEVLDEAIECYKKDTTFQAGRGVYRVLSNGDVTYVKPLYPEDTYFQVPNDVVCPEGFPFKVVKVSVNAFKGCTNVTKIWMGKNIVTIGKYAFKGATNLRTLIVRTQAIDVTEKIENAFAGMAANRNGKVNVQIWEKMLSKYEPMFRGAGKLPAKAYFTTIG